MWVQILILLGTCKLCDRLFYNSVCELKRAAPYDKTVGRARVHILPGQRALFLAGAPKCQHFPASTLGNVGARSSQLPSGP